MFIISVRQLLAPFRVGIRSKLFICLILIISAYSLYFTRNPHIKFASLFAFLVATELMIILWGTFFINTFLQAFSWKRTISWEEIPMFAKFRKIVLKKGVKLHSKKPFGIQKNLDNAYANYMTKQVIFGEILIKRLPENILVRVE